MAKKPTNGSHEPFPTTSKAVRGIAKTLCEARSAMAQAAALLESLADKMAEREKP